MDQTDKKPVYLVICWVVVVYDSTTFGNSAKVTNKADLRYWGIVCRTPKGLIGLPVSPFVHVNYAHVAANSFGILILGLILLFRGFKTFFFLSLFVIAFGGFGLWCVGRYQKNHEIIIHLGSNLLLFGWLAYLLFIPCFEKPLKFKTLGITLLVGLLYGSSILLIFRSDDRVSWEGLICGFFAGLLALFVEWLVIAKIKESCGKYKKTADKELEQGGLPEKENDDAVVALDIQTTDDHIDDRSIQLDERVYNLENPSDQGHRSSGQNVTPSNPFDDPDD
eukprot:TRINITY_DN6199_c0_g1_i4.p1 TRINITY_DN6199_c0_g1~~TRINITY_DN6199_c0_g1_i4.p1  ORF type:complete len:279 (+),score=26.60 TRINITY_DN6199_c0_g1_i4:54-890(+)